MKSQTRAAATMSVTAAASGLVVLLLTVTGTVRLHSCFTLFYTRTSDSPEVSLRKKVKI